MGAAEGTRNVAVLFANPLSDRGARTAYRSLTRGDSSLRDRRRRRTARQGCRPRERHDLIRQARGDGQHALRGGRGRGLPSGHVTVWDRFPTGVPRGLADSTPHPASSICVNLRNRWMRFFSPVGGFDSPTAEAVGHPLF
jgi:hypothetical protein